ncbi:lipopolysaccharide biosynthesis protein [Rhizohabitans arisaemae]|uniref:lipopolysaccharide biosynthesis protein n=1 Tax=Rhizohabitans arisaemae TaxID=2720610 RepID=UPI0024B0E294|nr:lipopolysaccharide biosynthesis protein [Rhizohabitans arisaemae]
MTQDQTDAEAPVRENLRLTLVGAATGAGCQLLVVVIVARGFPPAVAGDFFTSTSLILLVAAIVRLDAGTGLLHFIAGTGGYRHPHAVLLPVLGLSALAAAALTLRLPPPVCCALPFIVFLDVVLAASRGYGDLATTALVGGIGRPLAQLGLVAATTSADLLLIAWSLPYLPATVLAVVRLHRAARSTQAVAATGFWRHTWPRSVASALQAGFQRADILLVAALAGAETAALYTAATRFKVVGQLVNQALTQPAQPMLVRAFAEGNLELARDLYRRTTRRLILLTWPMWLGFAALAPWLLGILGAEYRSAASVTWILAATMMFAGGCGMIDIVLISAGRTGWNLLNVLIALITTVGTNLLLTPGHGLLGAALGWSAGVVVKNLLPLLQVCRWYGLRPTEPR